MSRLKPMIIVLLMLTSALAGCLDRHPDHHDDEPGLHHHGDEDYHHQHGENDETPGGHAESDRHHCHDDQNDECS